jgi:hypothetical protein
MLIVGSIESTVSSFQMLLDMRLMEVVRTDIHIAYDDDLWTFVPELRMLLVKEHSLGYGQVTLLRRSYGVIRVLAEGMQRALFCGDLRSDQALLGTLLLGLVCNKCEVISMKRGE